MRLFCVALDGSDSYHLTQADSVSGFTIHDGKPTRWAETVFGTFGKADTFIAPAQFGRALNNGSNACLAGVIAHEALHPVLYILSPLGFRPGMNTYDYFGAGEDELFELGSIHSIMEPMNQEETYIEDVITKCKVCAP